MELDNALNTAAQGAGAALRLSRHQHRPRAWAGGDHPPLVGRAARGGGADRPARADVQARRLAAVPRPQGRRGGGRADGAPARASSSRGSRSETAKKIVKAIKDAKLKVQAQIQGDELRVTGKNRDELQAAIAFLRKGDYGHRPAVRELSRLSRRSASDKSSVAGRAGAKIAAVAVRRRLWRCVDRRCALAALGLPASQRSRRGSAPRRRRAAKPARPPIPTRAAAAGAGAGRDLRLRPGRRHARLTRRGRARGRAARRRSRRRLGAVHLAGHVGDGEADAAKPNDYRETFVALANDKLDADGAAAQARATTTTSRCSASRRRCRCWRRASRRTSRRRARPATTRVDREGLEQCTGDVGFLDRDRSKRDYERGAARRRLGRRRRPRRARPTRRGGASLAPRARCWRRCARIPRRAGASIATCAGRRALRAVRARAGAPARARGCSRRGAASSPGSTICRRTRRWRPGSASTTSSAGASSAARRWAMLLAPTRSLLLDDFRRVAGRAGRRRGGHRRGRLHQPGAQAQPADLARRRGRDAAGARSDRRSRQRAAGRHRRADARGGRRLPARAQGRPRRAARRVQGAAAPRVLRRRQAHGRSPPRSIAATSGTTCRSTGAASRSCSGAITIRT